jgi:hypothetical protein
MRQTVTVARPDGPNRLTSLSFCFHIKTKTDPVINPKTIVNVNNADKILIKIQIDSTVRRYLFTAKSLYMLRVLTHPSSGVLKTVSAASGTGHIFDTWHNIGTATSLQRGQIGPAGVR